MDAIRQRCLGMTFHALAEQTGLATNNVFEMLEFRNQDHLKPFFKNLKDREKVEWVCTDMWRPFKRSFSEYLPNARLVIDKFHVVRGAR